MKFLLIICIFLSPISLFSQERFEFRLRDRETNEPVEQAIIQVTSSNKYIESQKDGSFVLFGNLNDTIRIFHIGYETKLLLLNELKTQKEILLDIVNETLNPVLLNNTRILLGNYQKKISNKKNFFLHPNPGFEYALFIRDSLYNSLPIKKIGIKISKGGYHGAIFKFHIYKNENKVPSRDLLKSELIFSTENIKNNEYICDIETLSIKLPIEGLFIGIECLAVIDKRTKKIITDKYPNLMNHTPLFKHNTVYVFSKATTNESWEKWGKNTIWFIPDILKSEGYGKKLLIWIEI